MWTDLQTDYSMKFLDCKDAEGIVIQCSFLAVQSLDSPTLNCCALPIIFGICLCSSMRTDQCWGSGFCRAGMSHSWKHLASYSITAMVQLSETCKQIVVPVEVTTAHWITQLLRPGKRWLGWSVSKIPGPAAAPKCISWAVSSQESNRHCVLLDLTLGTCIWKVKKKWVAYGICAMCKRQFPKNYVAKVHSPTFGISHIFGHTLGTWALFTSLHYFKALAMDHSFLRSFFSTSCSIIIEFK